MGHRKSEEEARKLEHWGLEIFRQHVRIRESTGASGEIQFVLRFDRGHLRQIETVDKTKVVADMLPDVPVSYSSTTQRPK